MANETNYRPYFGVIYSRSLDKYNESQPIIQSHGKSKFQTEIDRPYIRTSKGILNQQAEMALSGISATEIYGTQLTQSDLYTLESQFNEPSNLKQVQNSLRNVRDMRKNLKIL